MDLRSNLHRGKRRDDMRLSELIAAMEKVKAEYGDLIFAINYDDQYYFSPDPRYGYIKTYEGEEEDILIYA